jgi:hypothetical protein
MWITSMAVVAVIVGCDDTGSGGDSASGGSGGGSGGSDPNEMPGDPTTMYCAYGAVSVDQLRGCVQHVNLDVDDMIAGYEPDGTAKLKHPKTNAEAFAQDAAIFGNGECKRDAGPFCRYAQQHPGASVQKIAKSGSASAY